MISLCSVDNPVRHCRNHRAFILLRQRDLRIVGLILDLRRRLLIQLLLRPAPQRRQRLEAGDAQHPGRHRRAALEFSGLPPDVEEHLADQVLRRRFVAHQPQHEPVHPHMVPREQHLHGEPVALGDPRDQNLVRSRLHRQGGRLVDRSWVKAARFRQNQTKLLPPCPGLGLARLGSPLIGP